jgi:hypothetical protein
MTQQFKIKFINKHGQESPGAASSSRLDEDDPDVRGPGRIPQPHPRGVALTVDAATHLLSMILMKSALAKT